MTSPLQSPKRTAESPRGIGLHPKPNGNIGLRYAVSILADRSEGHSNNSVLLGNLGDEIGPQRSGAVIEDDQNVVAFSDFADSTDHSEKPFTVRNV